MDAKTETAYRENMERETTISVQRRMRPKLPKRRWHVLGAIVIFALFGTMVSALLLAPPPQIDPNLSGELALDPIPQPLVSTHLNSDEAALPDLLAGDVEPGENPTALNVIEAKTDALGNAIGNAAGANTSTPSTERPSTTQNDGPKTILIDGQPIIGGSTELIPDLIKDGPHGPLPIRAANGNTALKAYARPTRLVQTRKPVSLIIGGLGVNERLTERAIASLPAEVTLSFAAHSRNLQNWIDKARADGHEVIIEIPMASASSDPNEPGAARTLKAGDPLANQSHLDWLLSRGQGYFGVINFNGDQFLTRSDAAAKTLDRFAQSGLGFISDGSFQAPTLGALARSVNLPYQAAYGLIDPEPVEDKISNELAGLSASAQQGGPSIGVGFAYPQTLQAVSAWIDALPEQSLQLVPASYNLNN